MNPLHCTLLLGILVQTIVPHESGVSNGYKMDKIRWCVTSTQEHKKCENLKSMVSKFLCVLRNDTAACINAIKVGQADAITLDGGDIYKAGQPPRGLKPIIAEDYGKDSDTCYYAVAIAKNGTGFGFTELKGLNSCHTGLANSAGWNIPIGTLVEMGQIQWNASENRTIEQAVSEFFNASCVPGAVGYPSLCKQCIGSCSYSHTEGYYDYGGAFRCLKENAGQVAFVKHTTVPAAEKFGYELLCKHGGRRPISFYKTCHLARIPAHAVVSRDDTYLAKLIWNALQEAMNFYLFTSAQYNGTDLMFKDDTVQLVQTPASSDAFTYLGANYMAVIRTLNGETKQHGALRWCAVGNAEAVKCSQWMNQSMNILNEEGIRCVKASTTNDCIRKILQNEADAITLDGGDVYTAGKCGLTAAMVEGYDTDSCTSAGAEASSYYVVAVVRKGSGITWGTLKGKKSCHTAMGRTAGWNVPMGLIYRQTGDCNFKRFFNKSCVPGAKLGSSFCALCVGGANHACKPNSEEPYFGYAGAFRCLANGSGDVAFVRHTTVNENTDGKGPEWATKLKSTDFELLCPNGSSLTAPVTDYLTCHLAKVAAHAVVTRPESRAHAIKILNKLQARFGPAGGDTFKMFSSTGGVDLLFKDSTECLVEVPPNQSILEFLGAKYVDMVTSLRKCEESRSDLERACSFHSCQNA
ncbi:serotransferrin-1-like isoform X2 [Brienomyrus brachyistius]|uniref:serotransferrin-1-like isoform X2 n=1 Tax=Brienomyrus brachyistius TaxID=42636 RepID=UPI0020B21B95|nr:serotransferrin-1-like isoform X2 [Brienomyrus brachyistius]